MRAASQPARQNSAVLNVSSPGKERERVRWREEIKKRRSFGRALSPGPSLSSPPSSHPLPATSCSVSRDNVILRRGEFEPLSSGDTVVVAMAMVAARWFLANRHTLVTASASISPSPFISLSLSLILFHPLLQRATFNLIKRGLYRTARWRGGKKSLQRDKRRSCASCWAFPVLQSAASTVNKI